MNKTKFFAGYALLSAIGCGAFSGIAVARKRKMEAGIYIAGIFAWALGFGLAVRKIRQSS